jgi:hypothetical protein
MVEEALQTELVQVQELADQELHRRYQQELLEQFMVDLEAEMV